MKNYFLIAFILSIISCGGELKIDNEEDLLTTQDEDQKEEVKNDQEFNEEEKTNDGELTENDQSQIDIDQSTVDNGIDDSDEYLKPDDQSDMDDDQNITDNDIKEEDKDEDQIKDDDPLIDEDVEIEDVEIEPGCGNGIVEKGENCEIGEKLHKCEDIKSGDITLFKPGGYSKCSSNCIQVDFNECKPKDEHMYTYKIAGRLTILFPSKKYDKAGGIFNIIGTYYMQKICAKEYPTAKTGLMRIGGFKMLLSDDVKLKKDGTCKYVTKTEKIPQGYMYDISYKEYYENDQLDLITEECTYHPNEGKTILDDAIINNKSDYYYIPEYQTIYTPKSVGGSGNLMFIGNKTGLEFLSFFGDTIPLLCHFTFNDEYNQPWLYE